MHTPAAARFANARAGGSAERERERENARASIDRRGALLPAWPSPGLRGGRGWKKEGGCKK